MYDQDRNNFNYLARNNSKVSQEKGGSFIQLYKKIT
jgi:hypothetical protein